LNFLTKDGKIAKTIAYGELHGAPKNLDQTFSTVVVLLRSGQKVNVVSEGEGGRIVGVVKEYLDTIQKNAAFCRALFDYNMEDPNLLAFGRGDIITLIERNDETGWYFGEFGGRQGVFPASNVELVADPSNLVCDDRKTTSTTTDFFFLHSHTGTASGFGCRCCSCSA
jgi:hypothetical protein